MKTVLTVLIMVIAIASIAQESARHNYKPKDGYVLDKQTAIKIAVAIWSPIYGANKIEEEKPYVATLSDGVWTVCGSLPEEMIGGVAIIEISQDTGCILRVSHGQ